MSTKLKINKFDSIYLFVIKKFLILMHILNGNNYVFICCMTHQESIVDQKLCDDQYSRSNFLSPLSGLLSEAPCGCLIDEPRYEFMFKRILYYKSYLIF